MMPPELICFEDITAAWFASALAAAMQLGLPALVGERSRVEQLASDLKVDMSALRRLLDVLIGHGYFEWEAGGDEVGHTSLSRALLKGRAGSFCGLQAEPWYRDCFDPQLVIAAMRNSEHPFRQMTGRHFFEVVSRESDKGEIFADAMAEITEFVAPWLCIALEIAPGSRVLDVGGGNGRLCEVLARSYPQSRFGVLDIHPNSDVDGVSYLRGDFLESVPPGFDHLILKNILHDWEDETAELILDRCAQAVVPGARLSVIELLLPEAGQGAGVRDFQVDWNVYCTLGGRERRLSEFKRLFQRTGWRFERAIPTATPLWILEARRD